MQRQVGGEDEQAAEALLGEAALAFALLRGECRVERQRPALREAAQDDARAAPRSVSSLSSPPRECHVACAIYPRGSGYAHMRTIGCWEVLLPQPRLYRPFSVGSLVSF